MRLRHWCIETADSPGGMVMCPGTVEMTTLTTTVEMPDWFQFLVKDVMIQAHPYQHFGSARGACIDNTIQMHAETLGTWHLAQSAVEYVSLFPTLGWIPDPRGVVWCRVGRPKDQKS